MMRTQHSIFRDRAVAYYFQKQGKEILPRLLAPRGFMLLWILLGLLLIAMALLLPGLYGFIGG